MQPAIQHKIDYSNRMWLFLDYDGTLADFADTPEDIHPDPELIELLERLSQHPKIRLTIISGRRLNDIERLVPIKDIILAGTYGIELRLSDGTRFNRLPLASVRPVIEQVKAAWAELMDDKKGFHLEDKKWTVALHARDADDDLADATLQDARASAKNILPLNDFVLLGGHKFLEAAPSIANKRDSVRYLIERSPGSGNYLLVYVGDDDKDERAFAVIKEYGGITCIVQTETHDIPADVQFQSPQEVRHWLRSLVKSFPE
jgi:trehalose 6-phosphate phosphatase